MTKAVSITATVCMVVLTAALLFGGWHLFHQTQSTISEFGITARSVTNLVGEPNEERGKGTTIAQTLLSAKNTMIVGQDTMRAIPEESKAWRTMVETQVRVARQRADSRAGELTRPASEMITAFRAVPDNLNSMLQTSNVFLKDTKDSWDDMYWDVKAAIESGTVTMNQVGQSALLFPEIVKTFQETNTYFKDGTKSVAGITSDVHSVTSRFLAPRSLRAKIWDGVKLGVNAVGRVNF